MFFRKRLIVLDILRSFSAIIVMFYHYLIFFFTHQSFCAHLCCFSPLDLSSFPLVQPLKSFSFDIGRFAVALFFLISGFLMPSLLEKYPTRISFLENRFFRLWPVYVVGLAINLLFIWGACLYNQREFPYLAKQIFASFLCLRDFLDYPFITGVVWTFEIEVHFIIFCTIIYPLLRGLFLKLLIILQPCVFLLCFLLSELLNGQDFLGERFFEIFSANSKFFCFLFLGMYFCLFCQHKMSKRHFLFFGSMWILFFVIESFCTLTAERFKSYLVSYLLALLLFICFMKRQSSSDVNHQIKNISSFVSNISYPLYLIHAIPGYILIYILYNEGIPFLWGVLIAIFFSFLTAFLLHFFIEHPIRKFSNTILCHKKYEQGYQ